MVAGTEAHHDRTSEGAVLVDTVQDKDGDNHEVEVDQDGQPLLVVEDHSHDLGSD